MQQVNPARLKEPFLFSQPDADQFADALSNAARDNETSMSALHEAVSSCVAALKAEGMLCEAALLTMKAYTKHIAFMQRSKNSDANKWMTDLLMEEISHWSISDFYKNK